MPYEPSLSNPLRVELERRESLGVFMRDYDRISQRDGSLPKNRDYANCLHQLLEVALRLNSEDTQYVVVGGLAVLAHIGSATGDVVAWRGTSDIDLLAEGKDASPHLTGLGYRFLQGNTWARRPAGTSHPLLTYVNDAIRHFIVQVREDIITLWQR